jgi:hypothetical protein
VNRSVVEVDCLGRYPILGFPPGKVTGRKRKLREPLLAYPTFGADQAWKVRRSVPPESMNGVWPPGPSALPRLASTGVV